MTRSLAGSIMLLLSLALPAAAQTYYPRLPCTAFNLSKHVPTNTALDSAHLAASCVLVKQGWVDSVATAKRIAAAVAQYRADSIARAAAVAESIAIARLDNPYPRGTPHPAGYATLTAAQRATFTRDSLRAEFPVDSRGRACWKFVEPEKSPYERRYRCFRDQELDAYGLQGNLATFYRGTWANYAIAGAKPTKLMAQDGTMTRTVNITVQ